MNSIFCSKCGTKLFYSKDMPEKCAGCGKYFAEASVAQEPAPAPKAPISKDPHEISISELTDIHIDVEIDSVQPMTLKDLWVSASPDEEPIQRDAPDLPEDILKETISTCQPTQVSKDVGE